MMDTRSIDTYKVQGNGDSKKIAIVMTMHGIGDDIFAMPGIKAKRDEGFEITVFCKPFARKIWQSLGCEVYPSVNDNYESLVSQNNFVGYDFDEQWQAFSLKGRFGTIYYLNQWSDWKFHDGTTVNGKNRIHAFAELIETKAPKEFSWIEFLKPRLDVYSSEIIFAPDSASKNRCLLLHEQRSLLKQLKKIGRVLMFGQKSMYHHKVLPRKARCGKKDYLRLGYWKTYKLIHDFFIELRFFNLDRKKVFCKTFDELISRIYSAKIVIGTDNGAINIARAFGKDCIEIFGDTDKLTAIQFDEFHKAYYEVVRGEPSFDGIECSDNFNFILERTKQWQQHIMA